MSHLELSLLENGLDSLRHAMEHYVGEDDPSRRYKYSVLHLSQGVLLVLKERLRREHPSLVFNNVGDEKSRTVDAEQLLARLSRCAGLDLTSARDLIDRLVAMRNRIEHYSVNISKMEADAVIGAAVPFLVEFFREELELSLPIAIGQPTWDTLQSIEGYRQSAIAAARTRIERRHEDAYYCNLCDSDTATSRPVSVKSLDTVEYGDVTCNCCASRVAVVLQCHWCKVEWYIEAATDAYSKAVSFDGSVSQRLFYCHGCIAAITKDSKTADVDQLLLEAEVKRWLTDHRTMTAEQMETLLLSINQYGPSGRSQRIAGVFSKGIVRFADEMLQASYNLAREHGERSSIPWQAQVTLVT